MFRLIVACCRGQCPVIIVMISAVMYLFAVIVVMKSLYHHYRGFRWMQMMLMRSRHHYHDLRCYLRRLSSERMTAATYTQYFYELDAKRFILCRIEYNI